MGSLAPGCDLQSRLAGLGGEVDPLQPFALPGGPGDGLPVEPLDDSGRLVRNHVELDPGLEGYQPRAGVREGRAGGEAGAEPALFDVDERERRVGGEGQGRGLLPGEIVLQVTAPALLVRPQDQPHVLLEGDAQLLDGPHGVERAQRRTLVVGGPAPVGTPVLDLHGKGLGHLPAISGRDHVQMGEDVQMGLQFRVHVRCDDVVVVVLHRKSVAPDHVRGGGQALRRLPAKGHSGQRLPALTVDGHQPGQVLQQGGDVLLQVCVDLGVIHENHLSFLPFRFNRFDWTRLKAA